MGTASYSTGRFAPSARLQHPVPAVVPPHPASPTRLADPQSRIPAIKKAARMQGGLKLPGGESA